MKKTLSAVACAAAIGWSGSAMATPVSFDVSQGLSSVNVTNLPGIKWDWTTLTGALVSDLGNNVFTLNDNGSRSFDFFTLTASGFGFGEATVAATLGFDVPTGLSGSGSGNASWGTFLGIISAGVLTWDPNSIPDTLTLSDGNTVKIDFDNKVAIGLGSTTTIRATVTNLGGAAPVPEPTTMLLFGTGLIGLAGIARRKKN